MKFALPANYDLDLLPQLTPYSVSEIYGKLPYDIVGGGRPSYMSTPLSKRRLAAYVDAVHAHNMEFNYLMNTSCVGNREWTKGFQKKLNALLDWLSDINVDTITVSFPYLLQIIKKRYPHFKVKVGIYAQVDTVKRARYWESLGADGINLESFSINRSFEKLARIRQAVSCDLILIPNIFCQPNCPFQVYHQNAFAHSSGTKRRFFIDYAMIQCNMRRFTDPTILISAGWIRPEDLHHYEAIGYHTFKLTERNIPSDALLRRTRAYAERRYEGNLADILFSWGFDKHPPGFSWLHALKTFGIWNIHPRRLGLAKKFLKAQGMLFTTPKQPVRIHTDRIPDNFIDFFKDKECPDLECRSCGYCARIAEKAVTIDPDFLKSILPVYHEITAALVDGGFWELHPGQIPACE
jgi:collagenase-like PrtC family protease